MEAKGGSMHDGFAHKKWACAGLWRTFPTTSYVPAITHDRRGVKLSSFSHKRIIIHLMYSQIHTLEATKDYLKAKRVTKGRGGVTLCLCNVAHKGSLATFRRRVGLCVPVMDCILISHQHHHHHHHRHHRHQQHQHHHHHHHCLDMEVAEAYMSNMLKPKPNVHNVWKGWPSLPPYLTGNPHYMWLKAWMPTATAPWMWSLVLSTALVKREYPNTLPSPLSLSLSLSLSPLSLSLWVCVCVCVSVCLCLSLCLSLCVFLCLSRV